MLPNPSEVASPADPPIRVLRLYYCSTISPSFLMNFTLFSISPLVPRVVILCASMAERLAYFCTSRAGRLADLLTLLQLSLQVLRYDSLASSGELLIVNNFLRHAFVD